MDSRQKARLSKAFVKAIGEIRRQKGLTQEAVAAAMDSHRTTIAFWETGRRIPRMDGLFELAYALDVSVAAIVTLAEEKFRGKRS